MVVTGRRLWQHVTAALKAGDIDVATEHKHQLEERQRSEEKQRAATNTPWKPKYFIKEVRHHDTMWELLYKTVSPSLASCMWSGVQRVNTGL